MNFIYISHTTFNVIVILFLLFVCIKDFIIHHTFEGLFGPALILIGACLNTAVVFLNQEKMPIAEHLVKRAGKEDRLARSKRHKYMTKEARLKWLADIIWVPLIGLICSIGDIFIFIGILVTFI